MTTSSGRSAKFVVPFATDSAVCMRALRARMTSTARMGATTTAVSSHVRTTGMSTRARAEARGGRCIVGRGVRRRRDGVVGVARRARSDAFFDDDDDDDDDVGRGRAPRALANAVLALCASGAMATPSFAAIECAAELTPTRVGGDVRGTVHFSLEKNRSGQELVVVSANVRGLRPGKHGINVHENGDVSSCDAAGACTGKSYNPEKRPHRGPKSLKKYGASASHFLGDGVALNRHIGDLGNIVADEDGSSTTKIKDLYTTLKPGAANSLAGRSVVIRAGEDDFETEADDGNAGPIVAYGEIRTVK